MKKSELKKMIQEEYKTILTEEVKPSEFIGAAIKAIYYSTSEKSWVIMTSKGVIKINKAQSFIGTEKE